MPQHHWEFSCPFDNGNSWSDTGLPLDYFTCLAVTSSDIFAGDYGNVFSINHLNSVTAGLANQQVTSIAVSGDNIFVGTGSGVFFLTSNGSSCAQVMTDQYVNSVAANGPYVFAATGTQSSGSVFLSGNNGSSWERKLQINARIICLAVSGNNIFAGTDNGVYISGNNGSNWVAAGLTKQIVTSFAIVGGNIFAGTNTGVFFSPVRL